MDSWGGKISSEVDYAQTNARLIVPKPTIPNTSMLPSDQR